LPLPRRHLHSCRRSLHFRSRFHKGMGGDRAFRLEKYLAAFRICVPASLGRWRTGARGGSHPPGLAGIPVGYRRTLPSGCGRLELAHDLCGFFLTDRARTKT
jgi:hypothetical protein